MDEKKKTKTKAELEKENEMLRKDAKAALEVAKGYKEALEESKRLNQEGKELLLEAQSIIENLDNINNMLMDELRRNNRRFDDEPSSFSKVKPVNRELYRVIFGL